MKLQTTIPLQPAAHQINYSQKVLLLGSCFSNNIGQKLSYYKFQVVSNPFGILFQPVAIQSLIHRALQQEPFTKTDLFYTNERWQSFQVHSQCSRTNATKMLEQLNQSLDQLNYHLQHATHVFITLGTAWVYRYKETQQLVANCHKVPQNQFTKELLTISQIQTSLQGTISEIQNVNPRSQIIFTVSPVRHVKDGFIQNQQSKAHLITAIHNVLAATQQTHYFPAYEIVMDELRDYRFYAEDMLHPNTTAINYIWQRFTEVWIHTQAQTTMKQIENIQTGLAHRPFDATSDAHISFTEKLQKKIKAIQEIHPHITF